MGTANARESAARVVFLDVVWVRSVTGDSYQVPVPTLGWLRSARSRADRVRARFLNVGNALDAGFSQLLVRFALERILYRSTFLRKKNANAGRCGRCTQLMRNGMSLPTKADPGRQRSPAPTRICSHQPSPHCLRRGVLCPTNSRFSPTLGRPPKCVITAHGCGFLRVGAWTRAVVLEGEKERKALSTPPVLSAALVPGESRTKRWFFQQDKDQQLTLGSSEGVGM